MSLAPISFTRFHYGIVLLDRAAEYTLQYEKLDNERKELVRQRDQLAHTENDAVAAIGEALRQRIGGKPAYSAKERGERLKVLVPRLVEKSKYQFAFPADTEHLSEAVASLYATFDVDAFDREFRKQFPAGRDDAARESVSRKIVAVEERIQKHKAAAPGCLDDIPARWSDWVLDDPNDPSKVAEYAHIIVTRSVQDWRTRSTWFGAPTSPTGHLIVSLPQPDRSAADKAWRLLGLQPGRNPVYLPDDHATGRSCGYSDPRIGAGRMIVHQPA